LNNRPLICVCICTYKRPHFLEELLQLLDSQQSEDLFNYYVVVVDNDRLESGHSVVESERTKLRTTVLYFVEPDQNIAKARNRAIANSRGDFVAFIDDDEIPSPKWLLNMFKSQHRFQKAGVLGPVLPRYEIPPPGWLVRGRFYERPTHNTGHILTWEFTRTGNCLLRRDIFKENGGDWFLPKFGSGGEDRDFFRRMLGRGHVFVWCNDAPVYEKVSRERMKISTLIKRALLRGKMVHGSQKGRPDKIIISLIALASYTLGLPFLFVMSPLFGFDLFMKYLIKDCDHLGKLLALFNVDLVQEKYIV